MASIKRGEKVSFNTDEPIKLGAAVKKAIDTDRNSTSKATMREGVDYYDYKHEIEKYRLFYYDDEGIMKEEKNRSNIKIPHPFFTEQVDQKVQYLLSNPVEVRTEDTELTEYLKDYINEDWQTLLQEALEGSSQKGKEFIYVFNNKQDLLSFKIADALKVIAIYDSFNKLTKIIRYYDDEITKDDKQVTVTRAELWDEEQTYYFTIEDSKVTLDPNEEVNPKPHTILENETTGELVGKGFGMLPFYQLDNNKKRRTDLEPIKRLIDDYDLMNCALSNNLVDFDYPIVAVKGYPGDNLDELTHNLKTRKTIGVDGDGGIDVKTVDIPVNARKLKLETDKENIYKFGMAFDSTQLGDGNITNVVIKSRYSLLDLKCNKAEVRLRQMIRWMLELIVQDINEKHSKAYNPNDLEIIITREAMVNESDMVTDDKNKAETKNQILQSILDMAHLLDDETVLKMVCETYDLDYDEVIKRLAEQDYEPKGADEDGEGSGV